MTIEDKLTHDERLRLECVAQAMQGAILGRTPMSSEQLISKAEAIELYVRSGRMDGEYVCVGSARWLQLIDEATRNRMGLEPDTPRLFMTSEEYVKHLKSEKEILDEFVRKNPPPHGI